MESHIQKMIYVLKILSVAAIWQIKINTVVMLWSKMGNTPYNVNKLKTSAVTSQRFKPNPKYCKTLRFYTAQLIISAVAET